MSQLTFAAIIACGVLFVWTAANVFIASALWFRHKLVPSDKKILIYLTCYWWAALGVLLFVTGAAYRAGLLKAWGF